METMGTKYQWENLLESDHLQKKENITGSGSCPVACFDINIVESLSSTSRVTLV